MNKIILTTLLMLFVLNSEAQLFNIGLKGGLNYNSNGDLKNDLNSLKIGSDSDTGFHLGTFIELKLPLLVYVRPEFSYTHTQSLYNYSGLGEGVTGNAKLSIDKFDIPILVGLRILKIGRLFLGPSFQYIIDTDFDVDNITQVASDNFSVGVQAGFGLDFGKFGADVRWEQGISNTEAKFISSVLNDAEFSIDTRPSQFIFSIYYKFLGKKK